MKFYLSLKFSNFAQLKKSEKYIYITKTAVKTHRTPLTAVFSVYFGSTFAKNAQSIVFVNLVNTIKIFWPNIGEKIRLIHGVPPNRFLFSCFLQFLMK